MVAEMVGLGFVSDCRCSYNLDNNPGQSQMEITPAEGGFRDKRGRKAENAYGAGENHR